MSTIFADILQESSNNRPRLLFILSRVPYPLEKGDKLRAFHQLRILQNHFKVCLVAITDEPLHPEARTTLEPLCEELHVFPISKTSIGLNLIKTFFNGKPLQVGYFFNSGVKRKVDRLISSVQPEVVYGQLLRTSEYIIDAKVKRVLDLQDTFSKGIERRLDRSFGPMRWILRSELKRLLKYEKHVVDCFDHCTIISEQDRAELPVPDKEKITIVRNGVDMDYFAPQPDNPKNTDVLFAGNMGYPPNVMACEFLGRDVLPLAKRTRPSIRFTFSGARPTASVQALASDNIEVTGWVDDMRESYARTKLFVAPMMIGTGLQNKLLEAMSMGIPCITTTLANNALGATPDEHVIIAKSPLEFAEAIDNLLNDANYSKSIGDAGRRFVKENYGWAGQTESLVALLK
jgi:sugar transferase (PEP-CTERM/EpsH1 system associated)